MVKQAKFSVVLTLMCSSILLLLVLQVLWVKGAYRDAADSFRKETNLLFRNTVFAMHDSLIQRSIEPLSGDSSMRIMRQRRMRIDGLDSGKIKMIAGDSLHHYSPAGDRLSRVEVVVSSEVKKDSLELILKPIAKRMQMDRHPRTFIMRLNSDSLKTDSIKYYFARALAKADIQAPFEVVNLRTDAQRREKLARGKAVYISEIVPLSPASQYAVSFSNVDALLLRKITPQILFSVFLTLLTLAAFYVMYRSLRSQQRMMEMKNDFISNVTHELKTPVATVSVALEALKNFRALDNPQRTSEYLEIAQNELNRLTLMTDKILKSVIYEDRGIEIKTEKIDADALIEQILLSMKLVFQKRNVNVTYKKEGERFDVTGSETHLTNVIYNLLDNALKYSRDEPVIQITLRDAGEQLTLCITDNGVGIDPAYHSRIFEKFFRVPSGDVHDIKGYGLGLSYVAGVVRSHGGEINVESEPGKGSTFTITLSRQNEN